MYKVINQFSRILNCILKRKLMCTSFSYSNLILVYCITMVYVVLHLLYIVHYILYSMYSSCAKLH